MSIECQGVSKRFGSTQALEGISLTLESGHIYGLLGNNGAGKSTLLSILTDRQLPDQGTVTIDGTPSATMTGHWKRCFWWENKISFQRI